MLLVLSLYELVVGACVVTREMMRKKVKMKESFDCVDLLGLLLVVGLLLVPDQNYLGLGQGTDVCD